jgi:hypothetical protein
LEGGRGRGLSADVWVCAVRGQVKFFVYVNNLVKAEGTQCRTGRLEAIRDGITETKALV